MGVILKELYAHANQKEMALIAGEKGLNRPVRWLHMVESIDIASFLEGEEIAFVTGIGLKKKGEAAVFDLVKAIYEQGASAVVLNVGPYIPQIPKQVTDFCNSVDLPLFQVPWNVHMAEIMHDFSIEIAGRERVERNLQSAFALALTVPVPKEPYVTVFSKYGFPERSHYRLILLQGELEVLPARVHFLAESSQKYSLFSVHEQYWLLVNDWQRKDIISFVRRLLRDGALHSAAVSREFESLADLQGKSEELMKLCKFCHTGNEKLLFYEDMGPYELLFNQKDPEIMRNYAHRILGNIEEYDQNHDSGLLDVLSEYLQNNGSVQKTAAVLHIHRNTVNYKLHKIEDLLACDLSDFSVRFSLQLAMMVKKIQ